MSHSRKLNNQINCIHERALKIVYKNYERLFDKLFLKGNSKIHHRNLHELAVEIFKARLDIAPSLRNCFSGY